MPGLPTKNFGKRVFNRSHAHAHVLHIRRKRIATAIATCRNPRQSKPVCLSPVLHQQAMYVHANQLLCMHPVLGPPDIALLHADGAKQREVAGHNVSQFWCCVPRSASMWTFQHLCQQDRPPGMSVSAARHTEPTIDEDNLLHKYAPVLTGPVVCAQGP